MANEERRDPRKPRPPLKPRSRGEIFRARVSEAARKSAKPAATGLSAAAIAGTLGVAGGIGAEYATSALQENRRQAAAREVIGNHAQKQRDSVYDFGKDVEKLTYHLGGHPNTPPFIAMSTQVLSRLRGDVEVSRASVDTEAVRTNEEALTTASQNLASLEIAASQHGADLYPEGLVALPETQRGDSSGIDHLLSKEEIDAARSVDRVWGFLNEEASRVENIINEDSVPWNSINGDTEAPGRNFNAPYIPEGNRTPDVFSDIRTAIEKEEQRSARGSDSALGLGTAVNDAARKQSRTAQGRTAPSSANRPANPRRQTPHRPKGRS
ncbi:MAG: hypothetical protein M0026_13195 [Nocardiopsaceae bacterium]|nr:hypothetical protein [Nocardiopsaceae bacterium]